MNKIKILSKRKYAGTNVDDVVRGRRRAVFATKIIDITVLCPRTVSEGGRTVLKYMTTTSGKLVQCCNYDDPSENLGTGAVVLFNIEKRERAGLIGQPAFIEFACCVGISPAKLAHTVIKNAPAKPKSRKHGLV